MSSRFRIEAKLMAGGMVALIAVAGCQQSKTQEPPGTAAPNGVIDTALSPGTGHPLVTEEPAARRYYNNPFAVTEGMRLYKAFNCVGCHSNGGGGMGPDLMDNAWIYGGRLAQIHQTIVEGRPNGMPSWGGKIPDQQIWEIAAYVRSMSLPATLAANTGPTPSQHPAPVPPEADAHAGWTPPPSTTNDFRATYMGPAGQGG